ncbi:MAG: exopolysaccharide biosynthesis protein [Microcoleus sp.]
MKNKRLFSYRLENWLKNDSPKTITELIKVFGEKSFAISLLLLMVIPALPLPTGGITHIFEIIAILLSIEMLLGRQTIWLPARWQKTEIANIAKGKTLSRVIKIIKWMEKYSKPRLRGLTQNIIFLRITALAFIIFTLTAFFAPPFSGLDTLPSLAVVLLALAIILEDIVIYVFGLIIGFVGVATVLALGTLILKLFRL